MPDLDDHIKRINEKVQQLLKQYLLLQKENERLKTELASSKKQLSEKQGELDLLTLRNQVLKASRSVLKEEEKKALEKRITLYLKEIDRCIAGLNE